MEFGEGGSVGESVPTHIHARTNAHTHARTYAHTHTHTHTGPQISFVWTEGRLADLARKMLSSVAYLHQRGIAHR